MNQSPTSDLPSWDELDLPVLDEVVDESAIPVLAEEVLDVPDFDFSSEMDAAHGALPAPAEGGAELDIPELTLDDLEVATPPASDGPALDLTGLPSLDLSEAADELALSQVLQGRDALAMTVPPPAQAAIRPEAPLMAVDGFEFVLDETRPALDMAAPEGLLFTPPVLEPVLSEAVVPEPVAAQPPPVIDEELLIPDLSDELDIDWNSMAEAPAAALDATPALADVQSHPVVPAAALPPAEAADLPLPASADLPPSLPAGLSISLDSLPAGVLGGGVGRVEEETPSASELLARAQALVDATPASLDEVLRAAEQTLAEQDERVQPQAVEAVREPKSFTSLSEAELLEAMSNLPTLQPDSLMEQEWPGLGDEVIPDAGAGLLDEVEVQAASVLLQDEGGVGLASAEPAPPVLMVEDLPVLDVEESWPALGDVDRENETELALADETETLVSATLSPEVSPVPDLPVLDEDGGLVPHVTVASAPVQALFAESPFASERESALQPASPVLSPLSAVPEDELGLPVLTDVEPAVQSLAGQLADVLADLPETSPESPSVAVLETLAGASFAAAMPQAESRPAMPEAGKSVEVLSVAAVTTATAAAALMNPAARKEETVAVVDERALVDAMYEKLLPRMKVELSLWLQDALELQAKNMLSGVMQQLKEDYDMLFGETLKESLRQAILALGREQQGQTGPGREQD